MEKDKVIYKVSTGKDKLTMDKNGINRFIRLLSKYGKITTVVFLYVLINADENGKLICSTHELSGATGFSQAAISESIQRLSKCNELIEISKFYNVTAFQIKSDCGCTVE